MKGQYLLGIYGGLHHFIVTNGTLYICLKSKIMTLVFECTTDT